MITENQKQNVLNLGGAEALIAEIQQVSQAKTVLFMLQKLQKESEAQLKAIPASTGADKKQLLAQLRTNAEKWLQNFGLLLKNDQNNLNLFHQKMLQLAAKFGINIVAKKQEIPPAYLTLVNPYIEAFDRLDHRGIQATMVVAAQDLQIVNELRAMFVNIDALKQATPIFMNDANISFQDKMDLQKHINKIMWPKIKMVESYFQMSANPPANRLNAETQAATQQIATGVFDSLQQLEATPEANRTAAQNAQIKYLKKYQTELMDLVATTPFSVQALDDINQPQGWVSTSADANRDLIINVNTAFGADEATRTKTHEMQHLLQVKNGRLVMIGAMSLQPFYDVFDEIEAYQAECLVHGFHPSYPTWESVSTPQAISALGQQYADLYQNKQITLDTMVSEVENDNSSVAEGAWEGIKEAARAANIPIPPDEGELDDVSLRKVFAQWRSLNQNGFNSLNYKYF